MKQLLASSLPRNSLHRNSLHGNSLHIKIWQYHLGWKPTRIAEPIYYPTTSIGLFNQNEILSKLSYNLGKGRFVDFHTFNKYLDRDDQIKELFIKHAMADMEQFRNDWYCDSACKKFRKFMVDNFSGIPIKYHSCITVGGAINRSNLIDGSIFPLKISQKIQGADYEHF